MRPDRLFSLVLALLLLAGPIRPAAAEALGRWLGTTV